uniref:C-type lectin domain-containing protein n=1 Tax=Sander lucioperca TaxID=283035 RepID=A0A8D0DD73_SANLU
PFSISVSSVEQQTLQPPSNTRCHVEGQRSHQRESPCSFSVLSWQLLPLLFAVCLLQNHTNVNCDLLHLTEVFAKDLFKDEPCQKREGGWELHGGKCDYFSTDRLSWELSRNLCKEQHGDLVKIDSREEQVCHTFWIGLTDSETEGTWLWADGSPLDTSLTFWSSGETEPEPEPDNWTGEDPDGEDCVRMGEKGRAPDLKCWFDKSCKEPQRCICEKEATAAHLKCV